MTPASPISRDMQEFLRLLNHHQVEFAVCGGHAVAYHGYSRLTMDVDILILPSEENARRLGLALTDFGFGNAGIPLAAFTKEGTAVSLGVQPNQIDLLTSMSSQPTAEIIHNGVPAVLADIPVLVTAKADLIRAKREAARPKDLADLCELGDSKTNSH
jgi:hypothetical protein